MVVTTAVGSCKASPQMSSRDRIAAPPFPQWNACVGAYQNGGRLGGRPSPTGLMAGAPSWRDRSGNPPL